MTKPNARLAKARAALDSAADPPKRRRLFFDIETCPNVALIWQSGFKLTIPPENIIRERAIICIAWKWEGNDKVHSLHWDKDQCDKKLLTKFVAVMHSADEIVTQNGDRFDTPWIRTRCLKHGISMSPDFVSIDTLKIARSKFRFNSNKLDYIATYLGIGEKQPTGFGLWKDITLHKDKKAMKQMVEYCEHDVRLLEKVWDRMNQYAPSKSSVAETLADCPECGSSDTKTTIQRKTAAGHKKTQLLCNGCGKFFTVPTGRLEKLEGE